MTMETASQRPILVTGAHRSGTTWVGRSLVAGGEAIYISEPFNVLHRPGILSAGVSRWYTYICADNESEYLPALRQTLAYRYHLLDELRSLRRRKDALRMGRDWSSFLLGRLTRRRPLLKDPFAVFSVPWFIERLGCQVVITVRHPAAFASSLKRFGWTFNFADLLEQPLLMRNLLESGRAEMQAMLDAPSDLIGQASLLWKLVYRHVDALRLAYPQVEVVRHEDLSLDPLAGYRALYAALGLSFTPRAEKAILASSSAANPKELDRQAAFSHRLDSRTNLGNWKRRLSADEIERVHQLSGEVAGLFYSADDWS
ncbi:MAG: sulfotransferase domain-containing protein [Anaerolineales bacterium]|nr:sulfotransferase domain-containing protein [Anaerolineales bacterium]